MDYSQSSSDTEVFDPLTPAQHTLTHHHVSITAVLQMIHHPNDARSVGVLTIEEQGDKAGRETDGLTVYKVPVYGMWS